MTPERTQAEIHRWQKLLCWFGWHDYATNQELFVTSRMGEGYRAEVVICWEQCSCCCHTRLVHILK